MEKQKDFCYDTVEICRNCQGRGTVEINPVFGTKKTEICPICEGTGRVLKHVEGNITVVPYVTPKI